MPKITEQAVRSWSKEAVATGKKLYRWDSELRGFGVYLSPHGTISWLVQKWQGGRDGGSKRISLGSAPAVSLEDARKEALLTIGDVAKGVDIVDRKAKARRQKLQAMQAPALREAVQLYLTRLAQRRSVGYSAEVRQMWTNQILPALGSDTKVASITKQELRRFIEGKQDAGKHGSARYLYAVLRPFFKWAVMQDLIVSNPMEGLQAPEPLAASDPGCVKTRSAL